MALNLEKMNNVYHERYTLTLNIIREIHKLVKNNQTESLMELEKEDKLAVKMINLALEKE